MATREEILDAGRHTLTLEEQRAGGRASVEARRKRKAFAEIFEQFLNQDYSDKKGNKMSGAEALAMQVVKKGMKGDLEAFRLIRDTVGEKPVEKIAAIDIPDDVRSKVESLVSEYESKNGISDSD